MRARNCLSIGFDDPICFSYRDYNCLVPSEAKNQLSWQTILKENRQTYIDQLVELLRIPSVSTSPDHVTDVLLAADWVANRLRQAQMENISIRPTGEHACVYGEWLHAPGKPTILIYGHFDVQPADPLELWTNPPFEPVIKENRIYARGATDMKGNLLLCLIGVEALLTAQGELPVNVKFLFEGQEEIGSRDLGPFVAKNKDLLACDMILCADGLQWAEGQPMMCLGVKGGCALQVDIETATMDLHSGLFGGAVPNAIHTLVELLATLREPMGKIQVEGFYDSVADLSETERQLINQVPFDASEYMNAIGIDQLVGEPEYTTYERLWTRPTLDVNGVWGGYQGNGVKTVIPAVAHAKITCRLVANQNPNEILDRVEAHLFKHCPTSARIKVTREGFTAQPYTVPADYCGVQLVATVLAECFGCPPYFVRVGGSLPIMDMFLKELNAYTVMVGFGLGDEGAHSPNEFMRLSEFERGQTVYASLLERLGHTSPHQLSLI